MKIMFEIRNVYYYYLENFVFKEWKGKNIKLYILQQVLSTYFFSAYQ